MNCATQKPMDIQGHRGCRGLMPENSLPAFEKAIDLGVTTLELDIAITKDNQVVVSHEPYMSRTICYDPQGSEIPEDLDKYFNLYKMTYEDIKTFDCGSKFHPDYPNQEKISVSKPLLTEVFELCKAKEVKVNFNIEIKSRPDYYGVYTPYPKEYVTLVLNTIRQHQLIGSVNLQSFDLAILEEVKGQDPEMPVALLVDYDESMSKKVEQLSFKPEILSPHFKLLSAQSVKDFHSKGIQVIPWTVNNVRDMEQMVSWQVDGIITDYPDQLIKLLDP